jgi:hypothetical protein
MHNFIHYFLITFTLLPIIGYSSFVPSPEKVHFGRVAHPRRWDRWCTGNYDCGRGFCRAYTCQCYRGYITWRYMDVCNYEQRTKLTAFLVSFFVGTFGVDWFVLSRGNAGYIVAGIIKLLVSCGCIFGWPIIIVGLSKANPNMIVAGRGINTVLSLASSVWWLTDWIRILADVFYDGNGAPLQPWGYYDSDRNSYRM